MAGNKRNASEASFLTDLIPSPAFINVISLDQHFSLIHKGVPSSPRESTRVFPFKGAEFFDPSKK